MDPETKGLVERLGKMAEALDAYSTFLLTNDFDMHPECPEADPEEMAKDALEAAATITRLTAERDEARARAERAEGAVLQAVAWFEEYAGHHAAKLAMDKAARNTERAMFLRAALAQQGEGQ